MYKLFPAVVYNKTMEDCRINVLGTIYEIKFKNVIADSYLKNCDGYCDYTLHQIIISKDNVNELGDFESNQKRALRHEIVHAMLAESGLQANFCHAGIGHDETMVDWIAIQFPKLMDIFTQLNILR
jgi:hypothetical protein